MRTLEDLKQLPGSTRLARIDNILAELQVEEPDDLPPQMLRWEQVEEMTREGISIGSHTMTHPILSRIPLKEAEWEIFESKRIIESRLGKQVRLFAYPNGRSEDFNNDIMDLIEKAGYKAAFTTIASKNNYEMDVYRWNRIIPWEHDTAQFAFLLCCHHLKL
jgi:peptidoglycan/xylan/chitin deacetylase (PgdA/CDA1 family)